MNRDVPIAERDPVVHVPCSWQMPDPEWSPYPPDVDAIRAAGGQAYYWVRGWNFVTPVMAEVVLITHSDPPEQSVIVRRVGSKPWMSRPEARGSPTWSCSPTGIPWSGQALSPAPAAAKRQGIQTFHRVTRTREVKHDRLVESHPPHRDR